MPDPEEQPASGAQESSSGAPEDPRLPIPRSTIDVVFGGGDLDPGALIQVAGMLRAAIDRANVLPPAARVAIASGAMGDAARGLAQSLMDLASVNEGDDKGDDAIPRAVTGVEPIHCYDANFTIPLGGEIPPITGFQKALWIIKRVAAGKLQAHRLTGESKVWSGDPAAWDDSMNPETHELWQSNT